ncbi:uncharacterized protein A4U43_C06F9470 [Asparagus officinalis]|uniref:Uncharacterized protein n=1 Tax=Asparagus officinalis TaxID=4686 RepID=A0A5P1EPS7_ASPOF|nr:uncharacterized protein A4U43_C06F9470 [Asparagus officinalis]
MEPLSWFPARDLVTDKNKMAEERKGADAGGDGAGDLFPIGKDEGVEAVEAAEGGGEGACHEAGASKDRADPNKGLTVATQRRFQPETSMTTTSGVDDGQELRGDGHRVWEYSSVSSAQVFIEVLEFIYHRAKRREAVVLLLAGSRRLGRRGGERLGVWKRDRSTAAVTAVGAVEFRETVDVSGIALSAASCAATREGVMPHFVLGSQSRAKGERLESGGHGRSHTAIWIGRIWCVGLCGRGRKERPDEGEAGLYWRRAEAVRRSEGESRMG